MIGRKLGFQPINTLRIGHGHDGRIVDQSVDGLSIAIDFFACPADLLLRAQIELEQSSGNAR